MEGVNTGPVRALAPKWSLAGDEQLLNLLQNTHQRIISQCQDVNSKLEEMASALDGANINLQNVNNKFMALSNSQFIESRVYDDDADLTTDTQPVKITPGVTSVDEITMLKNSLAVLERVHETAEILDDSDSDSDVEISVVLKPKDMYSHRPLPYVIGSQPWRSKWHAGLIVEDSDTDSSTSKQDRDIEQYSDSEEEMTRPPLDDHTLSESSSSLPSSLGAPTQAPGLATEAPPPARPADIAAALARRLAADTAMLVREEPEEYTSSAPAHVTKVYKPEQPATSAIFLDEPPPLEGASEGSSDEDIFAEINKHTPYTQRNKIQDNLAEDLFSFDPPSVDQGDIFSDFAHTHVEKPSVKQKSTLFEGDSEPEMFAEQPKKETKTNIERDEHSTKKPVGGISLFGSNKGAESIGAAILQRNQRKSSTSGDESESDSKNQTDHVKKQIPEKPKVSARNYEKTEPKPTISKVVDETDNKPMAKKEKDIFDDLFSKPEKAQKKTPHMAKEPGKVKTPPVKEKVAPVQEKEKTNVKDLFSDNLFDDIDDIFTSNVKIPSKQSNQKSIFDDDDLFSDIDVAKTTNQNKDNLESGKDNANKTENKTTMKANKSIFDSDDELFSEIKTETSKPVSKNIETHAAIDYLVNNKDTDKNINSDVVSQIDNIKKPTETIKERNLFDDSPQNVKPDPKPQIKSKTIFDSDSDDDIFAKIKTPDERATNKAENILDYSKTENKSINEDLFRVENNNKNQLTTEKLKANEKDLVQSPSLFEEDEIDDLFIVANKIKEINENKNTTDTKVSSKPPIGNKPAIVNNTKADEFDTTTKIDDMENDILRNELKSESINNFDQNTTKDIVSSQNDIFDHDLLEDDLFSIPKHVSKIKPREKITEVAEVIESSQVDEPETKELPKLESKIIDESAFKHIKNLEVVTETDRLDKKPEEETGNKNIFDNVVKPETENETLATEPKTPVSNSNIFNDIFTEPPAFEKLPEPKRSKNINALFDDDSDDESLFFKKDDIISDEKPEIFSKNANFDIFVDEPPAIDVDFITQPAKNTDIDDDLFSSVPKTDSLSQSAIFPNKDEDIFSPVTDKESVPKLTENSDTDNDDNLFSSVITKESVPKSLESDKSAEFNSVPQIQENMPDNLNVIEEKTVSDKPKIAREVSKIQPGSNLFAEDEDFFSPKVVKKTDIAVVKANVINKEINLDDELFASLPLPKSSQKEQKNALKSEYDYKSTVNNEKTESDSPKKIGKLNTKNFNINVNALIPGASPKKIPKERKVEEKSEIEEPRMVKIIPDDTDFEPKSIKNKDECDIIVSNLKTDNVFPDETDFKHTNNKSDNEVTEQECKTEKSIRFNEKAESEVLDNNLSKQRPKIQVKRRPSSRRARHEAVRKSAIDFGDDTDNSSSFDEPKPRNVSKEDIKSSKVDDNLKQDTIKDTTSLSMQNPSEKDDNFSIKDSDFNSEENQSIKSLNDKDDKIKITKEDNNTQKDIHTKDSPDIFESILTNLAANLPIHKDVAAPSIPNEIKETKQDVPDNKTTTKIVYILNDEDIFNTEHKKLEDPEYIATKNSEHTSKGTEGIKTLSNTYKDSEMKNKDLSPKSKEEINQENISTKDVKSKNKASLFDDSDEELFSKNKKTVKKTTIFDSDSEEDLFSGKKSSEKKNKEVKNREVKERKEVKGSLFGDDDDDDLFGVKNVKTEPKSSIPSTSKAVSSLSTTSKSAEPVFVDPLSMLGDD